MLLIFELSTWRYWVHLFQATEAPKFIASTWPLPPSRNGGSHPSRSSHHGATVTGPRRSAGEGSNWIVWRTDHRPRCAGRVGCPFESRLVTGSSFSQYSNHAACPWRTVALIRHLTAHWFQVTRAWVTPGPARPGIWIGIVPVSLARSEGRSPWTSSWTWIVPVTVRAFRRRLQCLGSMTVGPDPARDSVQYVPKFSSKLEVYSINYQSSIYHSLSPAWWCLYALVY